MSGVQHSFLATVAQLPVRPRITSNLSFDEWTEPLGSERLTGARLDRLTHHANILEMNGESYRLGQSKSRQANTKT